MRLTSANLATTGLSLMAIITLGSMATACSAGSRIGAQPSSPAAMETEVPEMRGHSMGGMSMDLGPADADLDLRFLDAMTPHHQGALEMAQAAQQKSQRPEIKAIAADIIQNQTKEMAQMQAWRKAWYPTASDKPMAYDAQMGHMMAMSPQQTQAMMMSQDLGAADSEFDLRFIDAMISHHEGAVTMAQELLSKTKRPEIRQMAEAIVVSQQSEIQQMKDWRNAWYGK